MYLTVHALREQRVAGPELLTRCNTVRHDFETDDDR
jgi:hypothetical protein